LHHDNCALTAEFVIPDRGSLVIAQSLFAFGNEDLVRDVDAVQREVAIACIVRLPCKTDARRIRFATSEQRRENAES
jgi:hypothetical protein